MAEYIKKERLYSKIAHLEELARARFVDTPFDSPARERYRAQLDARTEVKRLIADEPAAEVAPVRHGRWDKTGYGLARCSFCHTVRKTDFARDHYCPNCGAKMEGDEDDR